MSLINVAYYITGHGFGHVTRSIELIRGLLDTRRFRVHVVTNIPRDFFHTELLQFGIDINRFPHDSEELNDQQRLSFVHWDRNLDTGGIQRDVIHMDPLRTLEAYYEQIHCNRDALLQTEVSWLKEECVQLILMDATTLACKAGHVAGVKTVFVSNFSWDFIYQESLKDIKTLNIFQDKPEEYEKFEKMIRQSTEDMLLCTHYIRYPGAVPLPDEFDMSKASHGPLIARKLRNAHLRKQLDIPENTKMLLLGFGGHATDWHLKDEFLPPGWICYVLRANPDLMPSPRFRSLPHDVYVPDWTHAADVVLGKVGYGFVSECLSGGTPLVYVPRVYWSEEDYLVDLIRDRFQAALPISLEEFNRGNWAGYLEAALLKKGSWTIPANEHPNIATDEIIRILDEVLQK